MLLAEGFDWSVILADKGIAVVALVAIGVGAWRVCRFLGPLAVDFVAGHSSLMATLEKTSLKQTEILEDHGEKLSQIRTAIQSVPCFAKTQNAEQKQGSSGNWQPPQLQPTGGG